jgi:hypothetical protein
MVAVTLIDGMSSDCRPVGNYFFFMVAVTLIDGMSSDCRPVVLLGGSLSWSRVASPCVSYEEEDTCLLAGLESLVHVCHMRRRIHRCHMRSRIHVS